MKVIRGHIIGLNPNNKQITYFKKACGVARFVYNWALAEWKRQYEEYKTYRNDCLNSLGRFFRTVKFCKLLHNFKKSCIIQIMD